MPTRVLVIDADTTFGGELRAHLNLKGLAAVVVSNGRVGLERALSSKPKVVVLAAELPGMNGFRVCSKLRRDAGLTGTKILMLYEAASRSAVREHQKIATHADSYLKKPVFVEELAARIERLEGTRASVPPPKARRTGRSIPPAKAPSRRPPAVDPAHATQLAEAKGEVDEARKEAEAARKDAEAAKKDTGAAKKEQERLRKLLLDRDAKLTALEKEAQRLRKSPQTSQSSPSLRPLSTGSVASKPPLAPIKDVPDPKLDQANAKVKTLTGDLAKRDKTLAAQREEIATLKAELEGQRLLLDAQRQGPPSRIAAASQRDLRVTQLEESENQMRSERDVALRRAEVAEQELTNFGRALDAVNGELEREKIANRRERETIEKRVASLTNELETMRQDAPKAAVDERIAAALREASREHNKELAHLRGEQAAAVTLLKREITQLLGHKERAEEEARDLKTTNATLREEMMLLRQEADKRVERLKGTQRMEIEAAVLAAIEKERRLAAEEEARRGHLAKTVNAEVDEGHKEEIARLQDQFAETLSAQGRRHAKELAARDEELRLLREKLT